MATDTLYVRIHADIKAELVRLSDETNLSLVKVVEHVLARGLGHDHTSAVRRLDALIDGENADG